MNLNMFRIPTHDNIIAANNQNNPKKEFNLFDDLDELMGYSKIEINKVNQSNDNIISK